MQTHRPQIVGYSRVSTIGQSLDVQIAQLKAAGCDKIFEEKDSGANDERLVLAAALKYVRRGDTLVVCKLDRLARSTKHLLQVVDTLTAAGAALKILNISLDTSTPTGKLMLTMLGAIATFERELMLERQKDGIIRAQAAGKYTGRVPSAKRQSPQVRALLDSGAKPAEVAALMGIGVASVYRIKQSC